MILTPALADERAALFLDLGFTPDQADKLARSRDSSGFLVTIHDVRETLGQGCPLEVAYGIYA